MEGVTDKGRLMTLNMERRKLGLEQIEVLPPQKGAGEALTGAFTLENVPVLGGAKTAYDLGSVLLAANRAEEAGEAGTPVDPDDLRLLEEFFIQTVEAARGGTVGADIIDTIATSAPFMVEFFISGGFPAILKAGAKRAGKKVVKKKIATVIADLV